MGHSGRQDAVTRSYTGRYVLFHTTLAERVLIRHVRKHRHVLRAVERNARIRRVLQVQRQDVVGQHFFGEEEVGRVAELRGAVGSQSATQFVVGERREHDRVADRGFYRHYAFSSSLRDEVNERVVVSEVVVGRTVEELDVVVNRSEREVLGHLVDVPERPRSETCGPTHIAFHAFVCVVRVTVQTGCRTVNDESHTGCQVIIHLIRQTVLIRRRSLRKRTEFYGRSRFYRTHRNVLGSSSRCLQVGNFGFGILLTQAIERCFAVLCHFASSFHHENGA